MVHRLKVEFEAEGGIKLRAWLFTPANKGNLLPAISMAHGYAGTRGHGIERSARAARMYEPGVPIPRSSTTPLLMVVATHDTITVTDLALAAYEKALQPKRLATFPGGHLDGYLAYFRESSSAAID
jgi:fermentation-respiration switch protein FrsA (DUF1100 family)